MRFLVAALALAGAETALAHTPDTGFLSSLGHQLTSLHHSPAAMSRDCEDNTQADEAGRPTEPTGNPVAGPSFLSAVTEFTYQRTPYTGESQPRLVVPH